MTNKIKLIWQSFESLTKDQLYDILNLRQKVFIIEQDCFYEDIDYFDQKAHHLLVYCNKSLIGYARVFPPGIKYKSSSIGRIVVDKKYRGESFGKKITQEAIIFLKEKFINSSEIVLNNIKKNIMEKLKALLCICLYYITFKKICFGSCKYCKL